MKRVIAALFALSLALSGVAYAHGDTPHVQGTVVSATDTTIVIKTKAGNQTFTIDNSTKVMRGKKRAALKDVQAGDRVVIHSMKHADHVMAKQIDLAGAVKKTQ